LKDCGLPYNLLAMPLILNGLLPMHWAWAGAGIAAVTLCLLYLGNRRLGISTGFEDICSLVLQQPYFSRASVRAGRSWRLPFLLGLVMGGFLSATLGGGASWAWAFDEVIGVARRQTRLDVRRRPVHRFRHETGRRVHERTRHLRLVESGAPQLGDHRQFHGRWHHHHARDLRRRVRVSIVMIVLYLLLGTAFGFILSRSGAADYDFIQAMFLFRASSSRHLT
jgi:hypothetical protein